MSRLAHVYRVPIRDSSTEGDCLVLATKTHLPRRATRIRLARRTGSGSDSYTAVKTRQPQPYNGLCDDFGALARSRLAFRSDARQDLNMKRATVMWVFVGAALAALVAWVASNTYWEDVKVPMPLKGEARTNPFYVPQRFAEALGARTVWDRVLTIPPTDSVIVLSMWHWTLSAEPAPSSRALGRVRRPSRR